MEFAVVTHTKLEKGPNGLQPGGKLEEPLVVRPTSETMIGHMYSQWVQSYRDLPLLINQWCNVMRWELRTRLFLRTAEFLWQEGHTAHETESEAREERCGCWTFTLISPRTSWPFPVVKGGKRPPEKFPGAMQHVHYRSPDARCKACRRDHLISWLRISPRRSASNFLAAIRKRSSAHTTSWGVSTRLIGAMIMVHSDDEGLVIPPMAAPTVVAVVPIFKTDDERKAVGEFAEKVIAVLVGDEEVAAASGRLSSDGIRSDSDKATGRKIVVDWRLQPARRQAIPLGTARRAAANRNRTARRHGRHGHRQTPAGPGKMVRPARRIFARLAAGEAG